MASRAFLEKGTLAAVRLSALRASAAAVGSAHSFASSSPASGHSNSGTSNGWAHASAGLLFGSAAAAAAMAGTSSQQAALTEAPSAATGSSEEYVLYQYTVCPFCCKTKAVMDYYKVPYRTVEVNPLTKKELKWSDYKKVPVLVMEGEQYNDSSVIAEALKERFDDLDSSGGGWFAKLLKAAPSEEEEAKEAKWRKWVDEWFVRVVTTNIYRSWGESVGTFDYISENSLKFGPVERFSAKYIGAVGMYYIAKNMKKKYSIEGDDRTHLYTALEEFTEAMEDRPFMGGDKPQLSDLYVFGVLRAIQGTETFKDAMANTPIQGWFVRMTEAVGESSAVDAAR